MSLYIKFFAMHLRTAMQHKASFFLLVIGQFLLSFTTLIGMWFLFDRFSAVGGFTLPQVMLTFSVNLAGFTFAEVFFRGFDTFPTMLGNGEFDRILARPRSAVFLILCSRMDFARFGRVLQSVLMLCAAIPTCGVAFTLPKVLTLILALFGSTALYAALFTVYATLSFWTTESLEFMNIFTDGGREFGAYPFSIYGDVVLKITTFLIPIACTQYYPLLFLMDKGPWWYALTPLAGFVFWIPTILFWKAGVRHYKSTGS